MSYTKQYPNQYPPNTKNSVGVHKSSKPSGNVLQETNFNEKLGKGEVYELKKKVQEINYQMNKRKRSAIKIQKVWRGFMARKRFAKIKPKLVQQRIIRAKRQKKKDYIRKNAHKIICKAIYKYVLKKRNKEKMLLKKYLNHCATLIQKVFRGFSTRMKYRRTKRQMRRFQRLLCAIVKGWKTRKILKHDSMINVLQDIKDLELLQIELKNNHEEEAENTKEEIPWRMARKKKLFIESFHKMYRNGSWALKKRESRNPPQRRGAEGRGYKEPEFDSENERQQQRGGRGRNRKPSIEQYDEPAPAQQRRGRPERNSRSRGFVEEHDGENLEDEVIEPRRSNRGRREPNAWEQREERPIGGKGGGYAMEYEDEENQQNAWNARDELPLTGKGGYAIPEHLMKDAFPGGVEPKADGKAKQKKQVAKKQKYDPRKAVEEAKKREEEGVEEVSAKNKKSEEFRNMIKNARGFGKGGSTAAPAKGEGEEGNKKKNVRGQAGNTDKSDNEQKTDIEDAKKEEEDDGNKRFKFLKRKTKTMAAQKLDFKKVGSRINCWTEHQKEGAEKSPERPERPTKSAKPTITATVHVGNQNAPGNKMGGGSKAEPVNRNKNMPKPGGGRIVERIVERPPDENIPIRKMMKAYEAANKRQSPPKRNSNAHPIKIEELEKAFHTNFLNKLNHITQKFYSESGARDPEEPYDSIIPILRLNSTFFFREDMDQYQDILMELDEEYQSLQNIN